MGAGCGGAHFIASIQETEEIRAHATMPKDLIYIHACTHA